jgi:hypothetical protein
MSSVLFQMLIGILLLVSVLVAGDVITSRKEQARRKARQSSVAEGASDADATVAQFAQELSIDPIEVADLFREIEASELRSKIKPPIILTAEHHHEAQAGDIAVGDIIWPPKGTLRRPVRISPQLAKRRLPKRFLKMNMAGDLRNIRGLRVYNINGAEYVGFFMNGRFIIVDEYNEQAQGKLVRAL